jgi:ribonuclease D
MCRMSDASLPPPILVQAQNMLPRLADELSAQPIVAIDTESNSLYAYKERVCLIQFSIPGKDYLVDPLAIPDLEPLREMLASSKTEKVLHGAEYDVIGLKRDFSFRIRNLFDTRMAIRTLGGEDASLQKLLATEFGVRLSKRYQRANWGKRPLPPELLNYARLDTHYLLPLRERLDSALHQSGRWEENAEACAYVTLLQPPINSFDAQGFWQIHNARKLNPKRAAVLRELWSFRDGLARKRDVPLFKVLEDKVLLAIAQAMPRDQKGLSNVPGLSPGHQRRYGRPLLEVVERGSKAPPAHPPRRKRTSDAILSRFDRLRQWRKQVAEKRGLPSDIILPRDMLWGIAHQAPKNIEDLRKVLSPLEWRCKRYGKEILALLKS